MAINASTASQLRNIIKAAVCLYDRHFDDIANVSDDPQALEFLEEVAERLDTLIVCPHHHLAPPPVPGLTTSGEGVSQNEGATNVEPNAQDGGRKKRRRKTQRKRKNTKNNRK